MNIRYPIYEGVYRILTDVHPHCKNNYRLDRHGHACITLKA